MCSCKDSSQDWTVTMIAGHRVAAFFAEGGCGLLAEEKRGTICDTSILLHGCL